jgi:hypothetical protein
LNLREVNLLYTLDLEIFANGWAAEASGTIWVVAERVVASIVANERV